MRFEIRLGREAERQLLALSANHRSALPAAIETHLRYEPGKVSRTRIKRLRGVSRPQYRLRSDPYRVFYDIERQEVQILAIVVKAEAAPRLEAHAKPEPRGGAGESEG